MSHGSRKPDVLEFHWGWCDKPPLHRRRWCRERLQTGINGVTRRIHLVRSWRSLYDFDESINLTSIPDRSTSWPTPRFKMMLRQPRGQRRSYLFVTTPPSDSRGSVRSSNTSWNVLPFTVVPGTICNASRIPGGRGVLISSI